MKNPTTVLWTGLFLQLVASQSLPYNPTTILLPPATSNNTNLAYAFLSPESDTALFVSLNISSIISTSNLTLDIISLDLPFRDNKRNAFIPSISALGEISVYTGSCKTSTSAALWRFTPSNTSTIGNGTWEQETTTTGSGVTAASLPGADFLSTAFSFSTLVNANASETKIYVFGGMCPTEVATASTWQSAASYSNNMLRLTPSTYSSPMTYALEIPTSRGPPIAEAGFSITGLTPTYSNGSGVETQQQSFVLVGGHTQTAFINMSQVAIWGLPEESWSFVTVDSPGTSNGNAELAVKSTVPQVDSRSGHTAVLTEDGTSIIVLGGWVGDVSQAADPQLAVLKLGQGFGGSGNWQWTVPDQQPSGNGIYGHGAVMLPGNVMMVLGGYNISSSSNTKRDTVTGIQAQFFNATSMTWTSDYTNPAYVAAIASSSADASASKSDSTSTRVGLGAGLGLGLAAVIGALLFYFCYSRRVRRQKRDARERDLRNLSLGATNYYESPSREMSQSGGFPWSNGRWNTQNDRERGDPIYESNSAVAGYENLNAGVHGLGDSGQIPQPPKQIPRKPLHSRNARGAYQPTPTFDFSGGNAHGRANSLGTAGPIHPIYEADEDDSTHQQTGGVGIAIGDASFVPGPVESNRYSDPFKDPPPANFAAPIRRNRSVSSSEAESPAQSREREIQEWVSDWAAADALLNSQARSHSNVGRISPTRRAQLIAATTVSSVSGEEDSGRTASNLSERTDRSVNISTVSVSRSGSSSQGRSRSNSLRGFITGINPFSSTVTGSSTFSPVFDTQTGLPLPRSAGSGSSNSFNTARTSFPALQAEGETLLPRPVDEILGGDYSPTRSQPEYIQGSPSKSKPFAHGKGRAGWLGSLRRVFISNNEGGSSEPFNPHAPIYRDVSPTRDQGFGAVGAQPRRTVSAGATLWRRKQGKSDWEDSADLGGNTSRSNTFTSDHTPQFIRNYTDTPHASCSDDEDWDIEQAVQNRVVQVMFTVPKEKLRVVNADEDDMRSEAASSVAGGSLRSRKGSGKRSLRGMVMPIPVSGGEGGESDSHGKPLLVDLDIDDDINIDDIERDHQNKRLDAVPEEGRVMGKGKGKETIFDHDIEVKRGKEQKEKDKQKMSERERVRAMEKEMEREIAREENESPSPGKSRKSKVLDLVETIERRGSPER